MTNDEFKAREFAHDYFRRGQLGFVSCDTESAGYDCAVKMAGWKDEQWRLRAKTTFCMVKGCTNHCGTGLCEERILFDKLIDK